jgi:Bacterial tandem repeat domain 1
LDRGAPTAPKEHGMAADFVAWHNIDSLTLQTDFDNYYTQGYRCVSLSI